MKMFLQVLSLQNFEKGDGRILGIYKRILYVLQVPGP